MRLAGTGNPVGELESPRSLIVVVKYRIGIVTIGFSNLERITLLLSGAQMARIGSVIT